MWHCEIVWIVLYFTCIKRKCNSTPNQLSFLTYFRLFDWKYLLLVTMDISICIIIIIIIIIIVFSATYRTHANH